jgi:RNA polymerase sigma-70 factor, ECF subfamily
VRADAGATPAGPRRQIRGAHAVARGVLIRWRLDRLTRPALVNGAAGVVAFEHGRPVAVAGFTVRRGKIATIDVLADPDRLRRLDLTVLND